MSILDMYLLPTFDGLPLAVTASRALERYGDLVEGGQRPATLVASAPFSNWAAEMPATMRNSRASLMT
jgi:hypothetical protein